MGLLITRPMPAAVVLAAVLALTGCTTATRTDSGVGPPAEALELPGHGEAFAWGEGPYGLVALHGAGYDAASWAEQAVVFAEDGMRVVAPSAVSADGLREAIGHLRREGIERVAVLASDDATAAALEVGRETPELVDQLLVVSGSGDVADLGPFPKLFVASEDEELAAEAERMAEEAPGDWNLVVLVPGDAHGQAIFDDEGGELLLETLLRRLEERR